MTSTNIVVLLLISFGKLAHAQVANVSVSEFKTDSYSIEYPTAWRYKQEAAPDGGVLHMFFGPEVQGALPYCHTSQQPLNPKLAPAAATMTEKQRREFFIASSNQDLLFSLYYNLASAQGFRMIHYTPATLGEDRAAFEADFIFKIPQGFVYRVRSFYTFWPKAQLSVWCQAVSRDAKMADNGFLLNLATFQRLFRSVKVTQ